jgi:acetylornithine deacetylase
MELNMEALKEIQERFYKDFPAHPKETVYRFATPSTMKPTKWSCRSFSSIISLR